MEYSAHQSFLVPDKTHFGTVKREVEKLLQRNDFTEVEVGKVNIIVAEMTSNLSKHASKGQEILIKLLGDKTAVGIEILCLDTAPGMSNPLRMMEDGTSTAGTNGQGLGAIKRLSDEFDIYSILGAGTIILSRFYKKDLKKDNTIKSVNCNAVMIPLLGEKESGDGYAIKHKNDKCIILCVDGLGHGPEAHAAAQKAIDVFNNCTEELPNEILRLIDSAIKKSRGAVGSVASIDVKNGKVLYCGIGNISGRIISRDESRHLVSYNGTLGFTVPNTFNNHQFEWNENKLLVLHSDGLKSKWDILKYSDWQKYDTSVIAASLYKDNTRRSDDALVLTARTSKS